MMHKYFVEGGYRADIIVGEESNFKITKKVDYFKAKKKCILIIVLQK